MSLPKPNDFSKNHLTRIKSNERSRSLSIDSNLNASILSTSIADQNSSNQIDKDNLSIQQTDLLEIL
jgi:hypothetical protein